MIPAEKPVSTLSIFKRGKGLLALIPFAIAIFFAAYTLVDSRKLDRIGENGDVATATITDKFFKFEESTINGPTRETSNKIYTLRFSFPSGSSTVTSDSIVSEDYYNEMSIGDEVQVRFWRDDPNVNEIEAGATRKSQWITMLLSAAFFAGGCYLVYFLWQRAGRSIRVRDHGERRTAVLIHHYETGVSEGGNKFFRLVWRDSEGVEGRSFLLMGDDLENYPVGLEVVVYADPQGHLPSAWEGDVGPSRRA